MFRRAEGNLELRPMASNDIQMALRIIQDYDEDDAAEAQETYSRGIDGQFCLCENRSVIGVVGGKHIPDTDGAFGLSWTYLQRDHRRSGKGTQMLNWMIEIMKEQDAQSVRSCK